MNWSNWTRIFFSIWLILFSIYTTNVWSLHPVTLIVMAFVIFIAAMFDLISTQRK